MPDGFIKPCLDATRFCVRCAVSFAVWTVWLVLLIALAAQIYIASVKSLPIPAFLLRAIETRLAVSGVSVTFGGASFDPAGRILIENARIRVSSFGEPIATARALYVRIDPFALLAGRFEPLELRVTGVDFLVPAMLSDSGRPEDFVKNLDAGLTPLGNDLSIDYLSCSLGPVAVSAKGAVHTGTLKREGVPALPTAEFLARNYSELSKEFAHAVDWMASLDQPSVRANLVPSESRGAIVSVSLCAQGLNTGSKTGLQAGRLRLIGRFPLLGGTPAMAVIDAWAAELRLPGGFTASRVRAHLRGLLNLDAMKFEPTEAEVAAADASGEGMRISAPVARLTAGPATRISGAVAAWYLDRRVAVEGEADTGARTADLRFDASLAPDIMDVISARMGRNLRTYVDFSEPVVVAGKARFAEGWRPAAFTARFATRGVLGYHVRLDELRGVVEFDGRHLVAPEVYARVGDNFARGSYEQDLVTLDHRFLLEGRLRPPDISVWFGDWWPRMFANFSFPVDPPTASVDVHGRWGAGTGRWSSQFVFAETGAIVIRGFAFDRVHTRLFIRPNICDGLECSLSKGSGTAQGTFAVRNDTERDQRRSVDFSVTSSMDPSGMNRMLPPGDGDLDVLNKFSFPGPPPRLVLTGHFDGPAAPEPQHSQVRAEVRVAGPMQFNGILFDRASFNADWRDGDVNIDQIDAGFAGGSLTGKAAIAGKDAAHRLTFSAALADASLGRAATSAGIFAAPDAAGKSTSLDAFARDKSGVRLDLSASAEGNYGDSQSFSGGGTAQVQGPELGGLPLLGGLSKLLRVTALRFTNAQSEFKINGPRLEFGDVTVTGANSAIRASGTYAIGAGKLDFNAKIYPFQESKTVLKIFDVLSKPVSTFLEVQLTGTLDKPAWNFAYGPLNILRNLQGERPAAPSPLAHPSDSL